MDTTYRHAHVKKLAEENGQNRFKKMSSTEFFANVPTGQASQLLSPVLFWYVPEPQTVHSAVTAAAAEEPIVKTGQQQQ